ncbi:MAG: glycosyl hydrolase, partial [Planctomycetota bacterium]|nr:glycosyl hydrolase [Planctomycetota bacterium]
AVGWPGTPPGPMVAPGTYTVRLSVGDEVMEQPVRILPDPRLEITQADFDAQHALLIAIRDSIDAAHETVNEIRRVRSLVDSAMSRAKGVDGEEEIKEAGKSLKEKMSAIEEEIIQTRSKSAQDPLNFPIKINDKLAGVAYAVEGDYPPTDQARAVYEMLKGRLDEQLAAYEKVIAEDVPAFNDLVASHNVPAVPPPADDEAEKGEVAATAGR